VGVARRRDGSFEGRVQGRAVHNSAELARRLPLQLINSATFALLEGGPKIRRQFLDWGVFHVEHGFHRLWLEVHRCLRQRNTLLRHDRIAPAQMQPWNARLAADATQLDGFRQRYFDAFYPVFRSTLSELSPIEGLEISYLRGWERDRELLDILDEQLERDRQRGFTVNGPHRADLRVRVRGMSAAEVLSRGQQKLVICALKLAQARIFAQTQGHECVFLIDDLPAELDSRHRQSICRLLETMGCQVIVTCVDPAELEGCWGGASADEIRMFHVEQGVLSIMN
jgi:DNA replication and repair protein RecF